MIGFRATGSQKFLIYNCLLINGFIARFSFHRYNIDRAKTPHLTTAKY